MSNDRERGLLKAAVSSGIDSPRELANFMAQVSHESNGLNRLEEGFRYTKGINQIPVKSAHRQGDAALEAARIEALNGHPEKLAELMYGGRMGNDQPGDGYKYRGRGYIQLTGKDMYRDAGSDLKMDLVNHPELASVPENAEKIAVWYWQKYVSPSHRQSVVGACHDINGGENGLKDREQRFSQWSKHLNQQMIDDIKSGNLGQSANAVASSDKGGEVSRIGHNHDGVINGHDHGLAVLHVQQLLNELGYAGKDGKPLDTYVNRYGPNTEFAVKEFQEAHGLKPTGEVDRQTLDALQKAKDQPLITHDNHPDNKLYEQIKAKCDAQGGAAKLGLGNEREYKQALATMTYEAKMAGMTSVDHVVPSTNGQTMILMQFNPATGDQQRAVVDKQQAMQQPVEQSSYQLQQDQRRIQQVTQQQAQLTDPTQNRQPAMAP